MDINNIMKWCNKCEQWKELDKFPNNKRVKDGKGSNCKRCVKQYKENNKEYIKQYKKEYRKNNKEHIKQYHKQYHKQWYENNKEDISWKNKYKGDNSVSYETQLYIIEELSLYEDIGKSINNNNIECKCVYCGNWFEPNYRQIRHRLDNIRGNRSKGSEDRLYCSESCKQNCPIYNQVLYPKNQKPATSREVQPQLRQLVFERDNYTCQKCNNHKDNLEVGIHCHHIYPLNEDPVESTDIDNCITLCEDCHKEVHQIPGCTLSELRCSGV